MSSNSDTINNPDVMRLLNTMRDEQKKALQDINDEQKATKDMFGRELEKLKKELIDSIERKIKTVKDEIMSKVTGMQQKLKDFEKTVHAQDAIIKQLSEGNTIQTAVPFYPDVTIIARNVRYHEGENITQKINDIIHTHLELPHEEVIRCERTASRNNKPGVVKIQMSSLDSKIPVLRNKRKLNEITGYINVYMRSALSHTERVMERNFQTILREIPNGGEFRITGHGIVIRKGLNKAQGDETDRRNNRMNRQNPMDHPAGPQQPSSTGPIGRHESWWDTWSRYGTSRVSPSVTVLASGKSCLTED